MLEQRKGGRRRRKEEEEQEVDEEQKKGVTVSRHHHERDTTLERARSASLRCGVRNEGGIGFTMLSRVPIGMLQQQLCVGDDETQSNAHNAHVMGCNKRKEKSIFVPCASESIAGPMNDPLSRHTISPAGSRS